MLKEIYKLGELTLRKKYIEQEYEKHTLVDLFWECTLTCNAKCKHCGSSAEKKKYDGELTTEEIKAALKQVADDMDATKILINVTGGEPLVRKDLCEVMEYATNELGFRWGMTTNGILLNDENIEKFCQNLRKNPLYALTIWSSTVDTEPAVRHSTGSIWAGVHRVLKGSCQRSHRLPGRCFQRYSCRRSIYGQRQWKR